jgi:GNAT acetyltransferase-like protein
VHSSIVPVPSMAPKLAVGEPTLECVNPLTCADWNQLVLEHPACSVFHSAEWAKVLSSTYGHVPVYLVERRGGHFHRVFPLMEVSSRLTGRRGVSLPFTDFCDPLVAGDRFGETFEQAVAFGRTREWSYVESKTSILKNGSEQGLEFFTHSLDLRKPAEALFAKLNSTLRNEIRKCERSGVEVILATDLLAVEQYYQLHCLTRRKHGLPPQPFTFFQKIHEHLIAKGHGFVALSYLNGSEKPEKQQAKGSHDLCDNTAGACKGARPVAGSVFLHFGSRAVYKFSAAEELPNRLPATKLALWRAIQWYQSRDFSCLDLGRTSMGNDGLRRYKQAWGAEEGRVKNIKFDLRGDAFVTEKDKVYGPYNFVFRRCPLAVSRLIGRLLYPHLD